MMPALLMNVSSWGHHLSPVLFDDLNAEKTYEKFTRYGHSKTGSKASEAGKKAMLTHGKRIFASQVAQQRGSDHARSPVSGAV
jgi:hypothetical protein